MVIVDCWRLRRGVSKVHCETTGKGTGKVNERSNSLISVGNVRKFGGNDCGTSGDDRVSSKKASEVVDNGIKLFASSEVVVTGKDLQAEESLVPTKRSRPIWGGRYKSKKKTKKSKKDASAHSSSSESETERLKSVAVSAD